MQRVVHNLRSRPKEERHAFAVMGAFAATGFIALLWLGALAGSGTLSVAPVKQQAAAAADAQQMMEKKQQQLEALKSQYQQGLPDTSRQFPSTYADDIPVVDVVPQQ